MAQDIRPAHIRALAEIARRGSFSRAAEALRISQPAVSLQIRQLETTCGAPLLERIGKRALLTEAGQRLLQRTEPAFAEIDAAVQDLRRRRGEMAGRVRLGAGPTAATYLLPTILGHLRARYPGLEISLVTNHPADLAAAVVDNELDAALVALPVARRALYVTPVGDDVLVGIAPPGRSRRAMRPSELVQHPLVLFDRRNNIRQTVETWFKSSGVAPRAVMELGNVEAIKKLVSAGVGLSIVPAIAVQGDAKRAELSLIPLEPPLARRLAVIRRRDKTVSPALDVVLAALAGRAEAGP